MNSDKAVAGARSGYVLERTEREYRRLRVQARIWERSTAALLDLVGLDHGASCLDAGCGPGETMRLMADRVGAAGSVTGVDSDVSLVTATEAALRADGRAQCRVVAADLAADAAVPGGPYDLVFARLLLFHVPDRVAVLRRLWAAVAPGGHLVVQDHDLNAINVEPALDSVTEVATLLAGAFRSLGCDVRVGIRLPHLFAEAGVGSPDGTDVAGRIEPVRIGHVLLGQTLRSVLAAAIAHGVTDDCRADAALAALRIDADRFGEHMMTWPLLIGAWKRKAR
jgi:ubiquinone/menaquinone biosynthesis C-methylase UbiE